MPDKSWDGSEPAVIYDHLLGIDGDAQAIAYMLAEPSADGGLRLVGGAALNPWAELFAQVDPDSRPSQGNRRRTACYGPGSGLDVYVSVFQLTRADFRLVELIGFEAVEGGLIPSGQVLGVGALALLVFSAMAFIFGANLRLSRLEARLGGAALREQQSEDKRGAKG